MSSDVRIADMLQYNLRLLSKYEPATTQGSKRTSVVGTLMSSETEPAKSRRATRWKKSEYGRNPNRTTGPNKYERRQSVWLI